MRCVNSQIRWICRNDLIASKSGMTVPIKRRGNSGWSRISWNPALFTSLQTSARVPLQARQVTRQPCIRGPRSDLAPAPYQIAARTLAIDAAVKGAPADFHHDGKSGEQSQPNNHWQNRGSPNRRVQPVIVGSSSRTAPAAPSRLSCDAHDRQDCWGYLTRTSELTVCREFCVHHPDDGIRRLPHKAADGYRLGESQC